MAAEVSTERRFLSSVVAAYGSQMGRTLVRLVPEIVLARLLIPAEHGLFERALTLVVLAGFCRDLGVTYQVVRDPRQPYGTVLVWVSSAGALLTGALVLGAPLLADWDAALPPVLRLMALHVFFEALSVVPKLYFERQLEVGRLVVPEIVRGLAFAAVAITLAARGGGVWSFVAGELGASALFAALVWWRARGRIPLQAELRLLPELISRSFYLFLIVWCFYSVPYVAAFVLDDNEALGYYNKAFRWALLLQALIVPSFVRVFYPALVEYRDRRNRFVTSYRLGTLSVLSLETLGAYFLFLNAEVVLVDILLGDAWVPAVPLLRVLCLLPLVQPFNRLGGEVLKVREEDGTWLAIAVLNLVCLVGFGVALTRRFGPVGMAWANYLQLGNLVMIWRMARISGPQFPLLVRQILLVLGLPLPFFLTAGALFPEASWSRFAASVVAAGAAALLLSWRFRAEVAEFFGGGEARDEASGTGGETGGGLPEVGP